MDKFKEWFVSQYFYTNMRFVHGDALFDKDGDFFRILAVQIAWEAWQSRQAELDQLQLQINEMAEVGLSQESAIREKDKRIRNAVALLNEIHKRSLDNPEVWDLVDDVWEALRGKDQYTEHRTKAEEQIKKGARLTKHQIDLGDNNANS
jgi:hypothetical protein